MEPPAGRASRLPGFEIWQSGRGIVSIDNAVRLRILRHLEQGPRTLNELVGATKKAKSTLSAIHMPALLDSGLVTQSQDPDDARVKWFKLVGSRLGASNVDVAALRDAVLGYVQQRGLVPLRPILDVLEAKELLANKTYAAGVARRLGALVGRMLGARDAEPRCKELSALLEREGLGTVRRVQERTVATARAPWTAAFVQALADVAME